MIFTCSLPSHRGAGSSSPRRRILEPLGFSLETLLPRAAELLGDDLEDELDDALLLVLVEHGEVDFAVDVLGDGLDPLVELLGVEVLDVLEKLADVARAVDDPAVRSRTSTHPRF